MSSVVSPITTLTRASWWRRLHGALMPDYNRKAALYWWTVVLLGCAALARSVHEVAGLSASAKLQVAAGIVVATIAGAFPVKIPRSKNSFAAGEVYLFLLLILHGPAAASLAAASEGFLGAWRTSKRWTSRIASPSMAALAMYVCGSLFRLGVDSTLRTDVPDAGRLFGLLMVFAIAYSFANCALISTVLKLKRSESLHLFATWYREYGWVALTYLATASLAGMLFLSSKQFGMGVLVASVPIIGMFLSTLHYFYAQQEAAERERHARAEAAERETQAKTEAAEREAALAALHLEALKESESRFHSAFSHASIGMALLGKDGNVLQANRAFCLLLGYAERQIVGSAFRDLLDPETSAALAEKLKLVGTRQIESVSIEASCRHRLGNDVWTTLHCALFADSPSRETCLIVQVQDITARRHAEDRLKHIAYHDGLTSLANRSYFNECLQQAVLACQSDSTQKFAVLFLDFDRFKIINDSLGHGAGDKFLVEIAQRIRACVRPEDVVARLGGDEFAILMRGIDRVADVTGLAERLQQAIGRELSAGGSALRPSASVGITVSDLGYATPEAVLRDADIAMYKAKSMGRGRHALFDARMHAQVSEQLGLESDLRRTLERNELELAYQPLVRLGDGVIIGFEALARWGHAKRGEISPSRFIPLAEESGLIVPLSNFVLMQSCAQLGLWQRQNAALRNLRMHVNVSGQDLQQRSFPGRVARALESAGLQPQTLALEITEGMLMEGLDVALETLTQLQEMGVGLSVDDFGTGYSSLSYLSTLPINSLKIDRSFVRQLQGDVKGTEIVRAVVQLGAALGKSVIAEGIETAGQLAHLRRLGCEFGQGYSLGRPMRGADAQLLLDSSFAGAAREGTRAGSVASAGFA